MYPRILIALSLASQACTASPSHLEQVSKRNEAVAAAFGGAPGDRRGAVALKADLGKTDDKAVTAWMQQVLVKLQADVAAREKGG